MDSAPSPGAACELDGLIWCYVPGGTFQMGSELGEADERPVHRVELDPFWMTQRPVTWTDYCRIMGWLLPPDGHPSEPIADRQQAFELHNNNKIRLQYCEDHTATAGDWHSHAPNQTWIQAGKAVSSQELFGRPMRTVKAPWTYATKPMVAVSWSMAHDLAQRLSSGGAMVSLPSEAQWEFAARGGLENCRYSWGDQAPTPERCDFDAFRKFRILPSRALPPNGFGLHGMCGGVWEWCLDHYLANWYGRSPRHNPVCELDHTDARHVLRGGSWADCAAAVTVSFRACHRGHASPNIGFRLVRSV